MTTFTDKELIKEIKERISSLDVRDNIERRAYEIALASLEADPVAYIFKHPAGKLFWALTDESNKEQADVIPVYAAAPASVVPDNASEPLAYAYKELTPEIMRNHLAVFERYGIAPNDSSTTIHALRIALDGIERSDAMLHGAEPVSQTYNLPELIEGMEVSIDVSTCDADLGNRYFGTVTEALELDTAKNGYILLVQDAEPNFDVNGNSPVTPDSWISC
ncbi:putative phage protein [Escherichia coli]|nr:putative phage protein [Escherichia coli]